jgi:enterochelin esterase-like enzyme
VVGARSLAAVLAIALLAAAPAGAGTLVPHAFASPTLGREWRCVIYEPAGYAAGGAPLPVLYLLHGYGGDENDWANAGDIVRTADSLIALGAIPPCLVVMPDGGNSWWVDGPGKVETAFIEDLIPQIERTWRALPRREGRLIAGLSMGGYGALRFALAHSRTFGAAALLSPAIYDPVPPATSGARHAGVFGAKAFDEAAWKARNWPALWDAYRAAGTPVPVWIVAGDDDPFGLEREAMKLYERFREGRLPAELRIENGGHDWALWRRGLAAALPWMFEVARAAPAGTR